MQDSNLRPPVCKTDALPTELKEQYAQGISPGHIILVILLYIFLTNNIIFIDMILHEKILHNIYV